MSANRNRIDARKSLFATLAFFLAIAIIDSPTRAYTVHAERPEVPASVFSPPNLVTQHEPVQNEYIRCSEPVYDFGRFRGGPDRVIWRAFEIENICDRPVRIQIIESCAGLFKDDRPWIQPGQSIFVDVKLASGAFANGHVLKTIRVEVIELGEPAG